jgi:hypothetical protein
LLKRLGLLLLFLRSVSGAFGLHYEGMKAGIVALLLYGLLGVALAGTSQI